MEKKYKIGVLFCGGCNCYYDRERFYKKMTGELEDRCDFTIHRENPGEKKSAEFDLMLLINGCQSECLISADYGTSKLLINNKNYEKAVELIEEMLELD